MSGRFQLGQGPDDPAKVTGDDVNRWTDNLTSRSRRDGRRGALTPQMVAILWRNARPFFAWWASEEDAPNPFATADRPPEGDNSPDVIHLDDIRALVAACNGREFDDLRDGAIIRVMFDTGTRLGELAGIQLDDWDSRQDFLLVDGKSGPRLVPMSASTAEGTSPIRPPRQQPTRTPTCRPTGRFPPPTGGHRHPVSGRGRQSGTARSDPTWRIRSLV